MGCNQSKIENQELLSRCKQRKQQMKSAVSSRNALASVHSSYTMSLKNTGASLSDYAHGEAHDLHPSPSSLPSSSSAPAAPQFPPAVRPPLDNLPPPPPLPDHLTVVAPLQRAASMPGLPIPNLRRKDSPRESAIVEEEEPTSAADDIPPAAQKSRDNWDYFNLFNTDHVPAPSLGQPEQSNPVAAVRDQTPPPVQATVIPDKGFVEPAVVQQQRMIRRQRLSGGSSQHHRTGSVGGGSEGKRGKMAGSAAQSVNLLLVLKKLDDYFLRAYESANEVSKMLAATRMHYHSNFADNRGD